MSNNPNKSETPVSIEEGVNALLVDVERSIRSHIQDCEQCIRRSPAKSVLGAVAAGYCLHRLPVRALLVTQVRLLSALAPPALVLYGAAKVYEFLQRQDSARRS